MFRFSGHIARRAALAAFVSSRFIGGSSASAEAEPPAPGNLKPWENRWSNHVTGWHVAGPHPLLVRHAAHLFPPDPPPGSVFKNQRRVLVRRTYIQAYILRVAYVDGCAAHHRTRWGIPSLSVRDPAQANTHTLHLVPISTCRTTLA